MKIGCSQGLSVHFEGGIILLFPEASNRSGSYVEYPGWLVQPGWLDTSMLLPRIQTLGFIRNPKKSCQTPSKCIPFLGLEQDSLMYCTFLSPWKVSRFQLCLAKFRLVYSVYQLPGAPNSITGAQALHPAFVWAGLCWSEPTIFQWWHASTDVERRSLCLLSLARSLLLGSSALMLSLWATHVPGCLNSGADFLSRWDTLSQEWETFVSRWERGNRRSGQYAFKWQVFELWCQDKGLVNFQCSVRDIRMFLQELVQQRRAFFTFSILSVSWSLTSCHCCAVPERSMSSLNLSHT